jgi:hypothetical protein
VLRSGVGVVVGVGGWQGVLRSGVGVVVVMVVNDS